MAVLTIDNLQIWMEGYIKAWGTNDPDDIGCLFAEDGRYFTAPYREPWAGRAAIVSGWLGRKDSPGDYEFQFEILGIDGNTGFVRGWTTYHKPYRVYSNLWVVVLNDKGECETFTEWWMLHE